jgi:hypothetical protein
MKEEFNIFSSHQDEFVLIGPLGDKDRVLARSDAVGMDLIGYAMDKDSSDENKSTPPFPLSLLSPNRSFHRISSWPVHNPEPEHDKRKSSYRFAWVGKCGSGHLELIKKSFNANILDISQAISEGDREQLELSLAPILFKCNRANVFYERRQRLLIWFATVYAAFAIIALGSSSLRPLMQVWLYNNP